MEYKVALVAKATEQEADLCKGHVNLDCHCSSVAVEKKSKRPHLCWRPRFDETVSQIAQVLFNLADTNHDVCMLVVTRQGAS